MPTNYLSDIAQQGILGLFLALALVAIYFLYRENKTLQEKRVNDLIQARDTYQRAIEGVKQTVDLTLSVVQSLERERRRT